MIKKLVKSVGRWFRVRFHRCHGPVVWKEPAKMQVMNFFMANSTDAEISLCSCEVCGKPFAVAETGSRAIDYPHVGYLIDQLKDRVPESRQALANYGLV